MPRGSVLPASIFKAHQADSSLPLRDIKEFKASPEWCSPSVPQVSQRFADLALAAGRLAQGTAPEGAWARVRRFGGDWYFVLGIPPTGLAALGWPAICLDHKLPGVAPDDSHPKVFPPKMVGLKARSCGAF